MLDWVVTLLPLAVSLIGVAIVWTAARQVALSLPIKLRQALEAQVESERALRRDMDQWLLDVRTEQDGFRTEQLAWKQQMHAVLDAVEDSLDKVERKRRSTQAAADRRARLEGEQGGGTPDPYDRVAWAQVARQRGLIS